MTDTTQGFIELFQGNREAVGTEEGGCDHIRPGINPAIDVWETRVRQHLSGERTPIGVYPMLHEQYTSDPGDEAWVVKWGCIDFDEGEEASWVHAQNVHLALQTFGIKGWIERSRSKGYHVWIFLKGWTEAAIVRQALLAACQIVDAPTREINPKQATLGRGQLGNYVRLPYPGFLADPRSLDGMRRVMVDSKFGHTCPMPHFVQVALQKRTDVTALEKLASYYKEPVRPLRTRDWDGIAFDGEALDRLRGKARIIWEDGPLEGSDRSTTMYKLAMYLCQDGRHTRDEAFDLMADYDARHGKFADRPDRDARLNDLLDKAGF